MLTSRLAIVVIAAQVSGRPRSPEKDLLLQLLRLTPSIFPIVFAALMGTLLRTCALYRAEQGEVLGV